MNSKETAFTQNQLREILDYNPETGDFRWLIKPRHRKIESEFAGTPHIMGYRSICIKQKMYLAHRLAWFWMTGTWPETIDHIDGNPGNDRWNNLREATRSQNQANRKMQSNNTSGYTGVWRHGKSYYTDIALNGKRIRRGPFRTAEAAHKSWLIDSESLHGEFSAVRRPSQS